jgi:putative acetyltransferase
MIAIRRATDADRVAIARVHEASIRGLGRTHYSPEQVESWAAHIVPENYAFGIAEHQMFVAVDDDEVIGFGHYHDQEIHAVYVHPEYSWRGIGRMLMNEMERIARAAAVPRLHLNASLNAVPFYLSCGFVKVGEGSYRSRGGVEMTCAYMEKVLRS